MVDAGGATEQAFVEQAFNGKSGVAFCLFESRLISSEGVEICEEPDNACVNVSADDFLRGRRLMHCVEVRKRFGEFQRLCILGEAMDNEAEHRIVCSEAATVAIAIRFA